MVDALARALKGLWRRADGTKPQIESEVSRRDSLVDELRRCCNCEHLGYVRSCDRRTGNHNILRKTRYGRKEEAVLGPFPESIKKNWSRCTRWTSGEQSVVDGLAIRRQKLLLLDMVAKKTIDQTPSIGRRHQEQGDTRNGHGYWLDLKRDVLQVNEEEVILHHRQEEVIPLVASELVNDFI